MFAATSFSFNPFQDVQAMLAYDFMRNAFLAGGCIALASGLVGYFVVLRNQVFTTDALGHVAFTGGLGGLLVGLDLLLGVFASCIAVALAIGTLGGRGRGRDVAIGTVFAWVLGVGVLFLSLYTSSLSGSAGVVGISVLFGSIFGNARGGGRPSGPQRGENIEALLDIPFRTAARGGCGGSSRRDADAGAAGRCRPRAARSAEVALSYLARIGSTHRRS